VEYGEDTNIVFYW